MSNYPADIRNYDHDPRSPFYVDPDEGIEEAAELVIAEWVEEFNNTGRIEYLDYDADEIEFLKAEQQTDIEGVLFDPACDKLKADREDYDGGY